MRATAGFIVLGQNKTYKLCPVPSGTILLVGGETTLFPTWPDAIGAIERTLAYMEANQLDWPNDFSIERVTLPC